MSDDQPHDALFKYTFGQLDVAQDHFSARLPPEIATAIRWETLAPQDASYVDERLRQLHSDIVYRAELDSGQPLFLYVLFEHQSTPDPLMAFRLYRYMGRLWEDWLEETGGRRPLPLIFPMVLYHGRTEWTAALDFRELFDPRHRRAIAAYIPSFVYDLHDLGGEPDDALEGVALLQLTLLLFKHGHRRDFWTSFANWLDPVFELVRQPGGIEAFLAIWRYVLNVVEHRPPGELYDKLIQGLPPEAKGHVMTWAEQIKQQGRQEGQHAGQVRLLLKQVHTKFEHVPPALIERIESASLEQLDRVSERILTATSPEELFE